MADNTAQNGTATIRAKDRTGVLTQIFGLDLGIGGTEALMAGVTDFGVQTEDAASAGGEKLLYAGGVRRSTPTVDTSTAGDFAGLVVDDQNQLWTRDSLYTPKIVSSGVTLTTATTAYTAGDQVGSTYYTFTNCAISSGGTGVIKGAFLFDVKGIISTYTLFVFKDTVTLAADNAAFTLNTAGDGDKQQAAIQTTTYSLGTPKLGVAQNLNIPYVCTGTSLYVALRTEVGHTFFTASTDLHVGLILDINS